MFGAYSSVKSAMVASSPATKESYSGSARQITPRQKHQRIRSLAAQGQMDVAGVAFALVVLGHEGDDFPCWAAISFGGLVDRVVVRGGQRVGVEESDLVLAELDSPLADSTSIPAAYMVLRISRSSGSARLPPRIE